MKDITPEEESFIHFQLGMSGSFMQSLYETWFKADTQNAAKLESVFPQLEICKRYRNEPGYWDDLCHRWNTNHDRKIEII